MKKIFKNIFIATVILSITTSCVKDDDYDVVTDYIPVLVGNNFENESRGSGSNEVAVNLPGWLNVAVEGSRLWHVRQFDGNQYAEFSSFFSYNNPNDDIWLITSKMDFAATPDSESLTFDTKKRISNSAEFKVLISTDFDGNKDNISTSTWEELDFISPDSDDVFVNSGIVNLSNYQNSNNVYVAFRYIGSKANGATTTFQIDNIRIFENK